MRPTPIPIVLVHGVGLDYTMWRSVVAALPGRHTVTYDLIGHGGAPKPSGPYRLQMFVDQLSRIIHSIDSDIDLVGFSMGALVAQGFALSPAGTRLRRLVLLNAVHDRSASQREAVMDRVAEVREGGFAATVEPALQRWFTPEFATAEPQAVDEVRRRLLSNDVRAYADSYEVFATADAELAGRERDIGQPTLVATGSDDQRSTPAMAAALAGALPRGRCVTLPGLRHLTPIEQPGTVARLIDEFMPA